MKQEFVSWAELLKLKTAMSNNIHISDTYKKPKNLQQECMLKENKLI